ncbi:MAG: hypothetical protein WA101_01315 [Minisyncoccia bacterium]
MKKNDILKSIKVIVLGLVLSLGVSYAFSAGTSGGGNIGQSSNWIGPVGTPPASNVAAPINVGTTGQAKGGTLTAGSLLDIRGVLSSNLLAVFGNAVFAGNVKINSLAGTGNRPLCADSSGTIVLCTSVVTVPTVTTTSATSVTQTAAMSGGNVTSDGGSPVTSRGVAWSISSDPTITNSHTTDGTGTGIFTSNITGLTLNTTYHIRAYATNSVGTAYGSDLTFTTSSTTMYLLTVKNMGVMPDNTTPWVPITDNSNLLTWTTVHDVYNGTYYKSGTASYSSGTSVILTANTCGWATSWTGCSSTTATTCTVSMNAAKTVVMIPSLASGKLLYTNATASPSGTSCGSGPNNFYADHTPATSVTLTANTPSGYTFNGWSGADAGPCVNTSNTCTVIMSQDRHVNAVYTPIVQRTLTVNLLGGGTGNVSLSPAANGGVTYLNAGSSTTFNSGTTVTLTAHPSSFRDLFGGWGPGSCDSVSGTIPNQTCIVTMNANRTVEAAFDYIDPTVSVTLAGTGSGTISTANDFSWVSAGTGSSGTIVGTNMYQAGSTVTLTAISNTNSSFSGWTGCASTSGTSCTVGPITGTTSVTANFTGNANTFRQKITKLSNVGPEPLCNVTMDGYTIFWTGNIGTAAITTNGDLHAVNDSHCTFSSWSNMTSSNPTSATYSYCAPNGNSCHYGSYPVFGSIRSIIANFIYN